MPGRQSDQKREKQQYYRDYVRGAPTKSQLHKSMKTSAWIALVDSYGRLYLIDSKTDLVLPRSGDSRNVDCYVILPRTSEPEDDPDVDERTYSFPEDGDELHLIVHTWKGHKWSKQNRMNGPLVHATIRDPYHSNSNCATGSAVLELTSAFIR